MNVSLFSVFSVFAIKTRHCNRQHIFLPNYHAYFPCHFIIDSIRLLWTKFWDPHYRDIDREYDIYKIHSIWEAAIISLYMFHHHIIIITIIVKIIIISSTIGAVAGADARYYSTNNFYYYINVRRWTWRDKNCYVLFCMYLRDTLSHYGLGFYTLCISTTPKHPSIHPSDTHSIHIKLYKMKWKWYILYPFWGRCDQCSDYNRIEIN